MEYQLLGRPQRPKGVNIKQALKLMLVLAFCAWLVYQTKHSIWKKTENYGAQIKLVVGDGDISLGRKGSPSRFDERAFPDSGNVDSSAEESSDGAKKDQGEEEFGHTNEKLTENEGKKVEVEPEKQPKVSSKNKQKDSSNELRQSESKVSSKNKQKDSSNESRQSESNDREYGSEKYPKPPVIDDPQSNGVVTEGIDEVQPFQDENGVPPDCNETEIANGQAQSMHEENISDFSKGSRFEKSNIIEVASGEDNNVELNLEGTKNDSTAYEESNTGTIIYVDASGVNPQLRYQLRR
ncbi:hypothetical protein RIF29_34821 [Crotalaria pallida]|uniref:Uncharacterized protein n=1 Tax=Crotalaria pallida TaxID=3830 RepID=A0AAN9E9Q9_CROPI